MNKYILGDIHGALKALLQCIERSGADIKKDQFFILGDATDGWPDVAEVIEFLMSITNLVYITGNHDIWSREFLKNLKDDSYQVPNYMWNHYESWYNQGGKATALSYENNPNLLEKHLEFLFNSKSYYIDDNRLFLHGGYNTNFPIEEQSEWDIAWNRKFWTDVRCNIELDIIYDEVYVGHSPTINIPQQDGSHKQPMNYGKVWNMDTGATYTGMLSIMDIDSKEIWQSDIVASLYPDHKGRNRDYYKK